jgi:hypothetical protein
MNEIPVWQMSVDEVKALIETNRQQATRIADLEKVCKDLIMANEMFASGYTTPQTKPEGYGKAVPLSDEEINKFIDYANMQGYGSSYCEGLCDGIEWALAKVRGEK